MADEPAGTLELAVADAGRLLIELEKFRASRERALAALRSEVLTLGDRSRRLHRTQRLDEAEAAMLREGHRAIERLRAALQALRESPTYRAAIAAHAAGDHAVLARLLPILFEGIEHVPAPPPLFHAVPWLRRNRPRAAEDVVAEIARLLHEGIAPEGDLLAWGTDPALPAVELLDEHPPADPVTVRFSAGSLPPAVFRLSESSTYLVHVPVLRAPFEVLVAESLDPEELGDITVDHAAYRDALLTALRHAEIAVGAA
jgi:hypothetical protein